MSDGARLPSGWSPAKLEEVVDILDNRRVPVNATERSTRTGTIPYYGATGQVGWIDDFVLDEEVVLLGEDGAPFLEPTRPKAYVIRGKSWVNNHAHILRAVAGMPNTLLKYQLDQVNYRDFVSGTTRLKLPQGPMRQIPLLIAPINEQTRITACVDSYFTKIDETVTTLERVQRNLKRYRASVLKAAVEGRLVPTEAELARAEGRDYEPASKLLDRILVERRRRWEEAELAKMKAAGKLPKDDKWKAAYEEPIAPHLRNAPELPEGWCWATADMVGDVLLGRQRAPQYLTGKHEHPYLRVANIKDDHIDFSDVETMDFDAAHFAKYRLDPGDILLSEGQSRDLVGQSAIYRGQIDGLCFQKTLHRFRPARPGPSAEYAQVVFRSNVQTGYFKSLAAITTNIAHLTLEKFRASRFPLAPEAEQPRIVEAAERLLTLALAQEETTGAARRRCARLRQSILKWAFEGKLADQDPTDEPASVLLDRIRAERAAAETSKTSSPRRTRTTAKAR